MAFYGYNPAQFVQRDKFGIGAASQAIGQTVAQVPRLQREKIQFDQQQAQIKEAAEAAKRDWKSMGTAWSAAKNEYARSAQPLLDSGQMTLEEFKSNMTKLTKLKPMEAQKKDPEGYIKTLGTTYGLLLDDVKKRIGREKTTGVVTAGMEGMPGTTGYQATVPPPTAEGSVAGRGEGAPPGQFVSGGGEAAGFRTYQPTIEPTTEKAETKEDIARVAGREGITETQLQEDPRYASAQTEAERTKEERLGKKEKRLQDMTEYQEAMMSYRWAKLDYQKTKDVKTLTLAENRAKAAMNNLIGSKKTDIMEVDDQIRELKKPQKDPFSDEPLPIDYEAIRELEQNKLRVQDELDQLNAEKKMIGAIPGETRKFSKETGKETERTGSFKEKVIGSRQGPGITRQYKAPVGKMEQAIRDTLARKGVSPQVIEDYIAEKKAKGQL